MNGEKQDFKHDGVVLCMCVWMFVCTCDLVGTNLGGGLISLQIWLFALLRQEF